VWAEGVENRQQGMNFVNSLIVDAVRSSGAKQLLDIGCGVGGSMLYIAEKTSARIEGITISQKQAEAGRRFIASTGSEGRCKLIAGDFTAPETAEQLSPPFDIAYAIESFLHMPEADLFFEQAARLIRPGGDLYICDDFLAPPGGVSGSKNRDRLIRLFKLGWQVHSLCVPSDLQQSAGKHGFLPARERETDLTPYLELNRPRDVFIRILVKLFWWVPPRWPFWQNLLGGDSLQRLLLGGDLRYLLFHFKKV